MNVANYLINVIWPNSSSPASSPVFLPTRALINDLLNKDSFQEIFNHLQDNELNRCSLVCRSWRVLVNKHRMNRLISDAEKARALAEELGPTLPTPANLRPFLDSNSAYWPGKKNCHARPLIAFIPATTLNQFLKWAETKGLSLERMYQPILEKHGNTLMKSRWVVMSPVVPGSRDQTYETGRAIVASAGTSYQAAKLAEATVCIAIQILLGREPVYGQKPWTFARCEELQGYKFHVAVGGVSPTSAASLGGPSVYYPDDANDHCGVAALSEF